MHLEAAYLLVLLSFSYFAAFANGQQPEPQKPSSSGMGVSTGAAHPAVKDSKSRPITAGGFVDGVPVVFADVTKQAGPDWISFIIVRARGKKVRSSKLQAPAWP